MTDFKNTRPRGEEPLPIGGAGVGAVFKGVRLIGRQTLALIGLLLVILSVPIGFLTPFLPIGLPVGIFGSALLARNSVWGQRLIRHLLRRYPRLEKIAPNWLLALILGKEKAD
jgi:drug/metabolite transporter (DMT)-like permease